MGRSLKDLRLDMNCLRPAGIEALAADVKSRSDQIMRSFSRKRQRRDWTAKQKKQKEQEKRARIKIRIKAEKEKGAIKVGNQTKIRRKAE